MIKCQFTLDLMVGILFHILDWATLAGFAMFKVSMLG